MTAAVAADLLDEGGAALGDLPADLDLIGLLRSANAEQPRQAWTFYVDPGDPRAPRLMAGLNGSRGFLVWEEGPTRSWPMMATPVGPQADYWRGGHHFQVAAGEEIPAEYVYAAIAECVATKLRPTCIRWSASA